MCSPSGFSLFNSLRVGWACPILPVPPTSFTVTQPPSVDPMETLYSRCRYVGNNRLYMGRAVLTHTDLRVTGWSGAHHVVYRIPLDAVTRLERASRKREPMLVVETKDGAELALGVSAPGLWRWAVRQRLPEAHSLSLETDAGPAHVVDSPPDVPPDTSATPAANEDGTSAAQEKTGSQPPFAIRVAYTARDREPVVYEARVRWQPLAELISS